MIRNHLEIYNLTEKIALNNNEMEREDSCRLHLVET